MSQKALARRQFIQFLAASPLFAGLNPGRLLADMVSDGSATSSTGLADTLLGRINSPEDALDVFDFQRVAEHVLPPAHYGYLATGNVCQPFSDFFNGICSRSFLVNEVKKPDPDIIRRILTEHGTTARPTHRSGIYISNIA